MNRIVDYGPSGGSESEQMIWLSFAYAQSGSVLMDSIVNEESDQNYSRVRVVLHLCRHALELFLKGAIGVADGSVNRKTHRLSELYEVYSRAYPEPIYQFRTPFHGSAIRLVDLFPETLEGFHRVHDQIYRYPADNKGRFFQRFEDFDLDVDVDFLREFVQNLQHAGMAILYKL